MKIVAKTPEGLFIPIRFRAIISKNTFDAAKAALAALPEDSIHQKARPAIEALGRMAVRDDWMPLNPMDIGFNPKTHAKLLEAKRRQDKGERLRHMEQPSFFLQYASIPSVGWGRPEAPKTRSSSTSSADFTSAQEAGWHDIATVKKHLGALNGLLESIGAATVNTYAVEGAAAASKRAADTEFCSIDDEQRMASSASWIVHIENWGYMDSQGFGPIGRAKMFESVEAAKKAAISRGYSSWKIARVRVELEALEAVQGDSESHDLSAAISIQEAKDIRKALENASVETLRQALAEAQALLSQKTSDTHSQAAQPRAAPRSKRRL